MLDSTFLWLNLLLEFQCSDFGLSIALRANRQQLIGDEHLFQPFRAANYQFHHSNPE